MNIKIRLTGEVSSSFCNCFVHDMVSLTKIATRWLQVHKKGTCVLANLKCVVPVLTITADNIGWNQIKLVTSLQSFLAIMCTNTQINRLFICLSAGIYTQAHTVSFTPPLSLPTSASEYHTSSSSVHLCATSMYLGRQVANNK